MTIRIRAGRLITPLQEIENGAVLVDGGAIAAVGPDGAVPHPPDAETVDAGDRTVCPGFVDCHVHGGGGYSLMGSPEEISAVATRLASHGATSFLATLVGAPSLERLLDSIRAVVAVRRQSLATAQIGGIHLEGPFISPRKPGANVVANMRAPSAVELEQMVEAAEGTVRVVTIAPELEGALDLIRAAARLGIVASVGHTDATYEQVEAGVEAGIRYATHTYNAMHGLGHRAPGAVGAILTDDRIWAELIGDGVHVGAVAMQVLLRCKGPERVLLVTDNIRWAGLPEGDYGPPDRRVSVAGGACRLSDGTLAGSTSPIIENVRNLMELTGVSLREAVQMASLNPCRAIGVDASKGSLEPGKDADLLVLDGNLSLELAMNRGRIIYRAPTAPKIDEPVM